jgi:hypothetical protein
MDPSGATALTIFRVSKETRGAGPDTGCDFKVKVKAGAVAGISSIPSNPCGAGNF